MRIKGVYNISNTDAENFNRDLNNAILILQKDNQEVDVQYHVNSFPNGQIVYSALVIGREM